jgi:hypothetical protein
VNERVKSRRDGWKSSQEEKIFRHSGAGNAKKKQKLAADLRRSALIKARSHLINGAS